MSDTASAPRPVVEPGLASPRALRVYVAVVVALAAVAVHLSGDVWGLPSDPVPVLVLTAMGVASWLLRDPDVARGVNLSFMSIVLVAAAALTGPVGAAIVGGVSTVVHHGRAPLHVRLFNIAMAASLGAAGGAVYLLGNGAAAAGHLAPDARSQVLVEVGLPLLAADLSICVLNAALVGVAVHLSRGDRVVPLVLAMIRATGPIYVGYGVIAFLWVVLWGPAGVGWASSLLMLLPLLVAQWALVQHGDLHRARARTLELFVTILDARHHDGRAHSILVGQVSSWTAEAMGLAPAVVEDVAHAGMLHDLGRLAEPAEVFSHEELATPEDAAAIRRHPDSGVRILSGIDFVRGSLPGIRHHHERMDGRGYPQGLAGAAIPLPARIVAAADCFEFLTSPVGGRLGVPAALQVLRQRAGDHLDPVVVEALAAAVARHAWQQHPDSGQGSSMRSHDDPRVVDALADLKAPR